MRLEEIEVNGIYETAQPIYSGDLEVIKSGKRVVVVRANVTAGVVVIRQVDVLGNPISEPWLAKVSQLRIYTPRTGLFS